MEYLQARIGAFIFVCTVVLAASAIIQPAWADPSFPVLASPGVDAVRSPASFRASREAVPKGAERIARIIERGARAEGVPSALAHAVVTIESRYNPRARGGAGEIGLMQIKPRTARGMGFRGNASALYDPKTNIRWGMKYLGEAYRLADGDVCGTILRYNAGHAARRMNPISARYCGKVRRLLRDRNGIRSSKL